MLEKHSPNVENSAPLSAVIDFIIPDGYSSNILFNAYVTDSLSLKSINTTIPFLVFLSVKVSKHVLSPFFHALYLFRNDQILHGYLYVVVFHLY